MENDKPLKDIALIMLNLTKLSRRQVSIAGGVSPQNATHWLNGRPDAFSMAKQKSFLKGMGLIVTSDHFNRQGFDLIRGKLHDWILDGNAWEVREILELCRAPMNSIRVYRYEGVPSREAILMVPVDDPENAIWIRLKLEDSDEAPSTIDSGVLGFGVTVNLSASDWFRGINEGKHNVTVMHQYFEKKGVIVNLGNQHFVHEDDFIFGELTEEQVQNNARESEWLELLRQILEKGYEFDEVMRKVEKIF